jgi:16S rRNA (cytidine1402-2'-O)-methyltransferase
MAAAFGADRPAVVCRELTKTHEEVRRGMLGDLAAWAVEGARGEITIVVAGAPEPTVALTGDELVRQVRVREEAGLTRKDAVAAVAQENGLPKREVFDAVVSAKRDAPPH